MGYIPPGPQPPFTEGRTYGQEPGFFSRNAGKFIIVLMLLIVIALVSVITAIIASNNSDDEDQPTTVLISADARRGAGRV